jgi:hypothetical protein
MGGLVISRAACRAISARRGTTAHITVVSSVLFTGYVVNKTVSWFFSVSMCFINSYNLVFTSRTLITQFINNN